MLYSDSYVLELATAWVARAKKGTCSFSVILIKKPSVRKSFRVVLTQYLNVNIIIFYQVNFITPLDLIT